MREPVMTADDLEQRLAREFPEMINPRSGMEIASVWHMGSRVRQSYSPSQLRPGGTIAGPTMMALADFAMYVALLGSIGWKPLAATANLTISFLKRPEARALEAECRLLKLGRRLAVGEVGISQPGDSDLVAHATVTYAVPQNAA